MRVALKIVVFALAVAGPLGGAAAQPYPQPGYYYYPPPRAYYYPPPGYYPPPAYPAPQSRPYSGAPVPPAPVGGAVYDPGNDEPVGYGPPPYGPAGRPYAEPADPAPPAAAPYGGDPTLRPPGYIGGAPADVTGAVRAPGTYGQPPDRSSVIAALPPDEQPESGAPKELPPQFRRQLVDYVTPEPAGTVIIDTPHTYLYLVLGGGKALRYGIGVGREGFTWTGTERISRMSEWPDWHPPKEMIERQPYLPRFMAGGEGNPLGARALYLGNTLYRIHGTNQPSTIGHFVSSGCIRLTNADIEISTTE